MCAQHFLNLMALTIARDPEGDQFRQGCLVVPVCLGRIAALGHRLQRHKIKHGQG